MEVRALSSAQFLFWRLRSSGDRAIPMIALVAQGIEQLSSKQQVVRSNRTRRTREVRHEPEQSTVHGALYRVRLSRTLVCGRILPEAHLALLGVN